MVEDNVRVFAGKHPRYDDIILLIPTIT